MGIGAAGGVVLVVVCIVCVTRLQRPDAKLQELPQGMEKRFLIDHAQLKLERKPVAAGGFAQVFRGKYRGQTVAVKVLHNFLTDTQGREAVYVERFKGEAEMMSKLYHPNIQGLLGVTVSPFCLVTEFAPMGSLSDVIGSPPAKAEAGAWANSWSRAGPPLGSTKLSSRAVVAVLYQVACGMHFLHTRHPPIYVR